LENFQPNHKAKIVLKPSLFLYESPVSLETIQKLSLSLHCQSEIPQIYTFPLLPSCYSPSFIPIEFLLPNNTESISLSLSGQFPLLSSVQDLLSTHTIPLTQNYRGHLVNQYLSRNDKAYEILVLGKNGEIMQGLGISLAVKHKFLQREIRADLVTDSNGKVTINNPNNVLFI
jgi:hypothetical protein